jgi:hypothetical protein
LQVREAKAAQLTFLIFEPQQSLEVFHVFWPPRRPLHRDQIVQGGIANFLVSIRAGNSILPHLIESNPLNKRVDIRLDEILPNKNLLGKEILFIEIRHIISEFLEGFQSAAGVFGFWAYEKIYVEGGASVTMDRKSGRSNDNELNVMSV